MNLKKLTPNLIVTNVEASLDFYCDVLGFQLGGTVPEAPPYVFGSVVSEKGRYATKDDLTQVFLAGAFGNYINYTSARRIGLLDFPAEKVRPSGNTALLGAKLALFSLPEHDGAYPQTLAKVRHVSLNEDPRFQETFVEEMVFP